MDQTEVLVTKEIVGAVVKSLSVEKVLAVDTETTGLEPFKGCNLFSIIVASKTHAFYFNFNWYSELGVSQYFLPDTAALKPLFDTARLWVMQNAKFDMHFLAKENLFPQGEHYDTMVAGRLLHNIHSHYSLDAMVERDLGLNKDDSVKEWLEKNKCYQMVPLPGRKKLVKNYFFEQVPFDIISKYGLKDAKLTLALYEHQEKNFYETDLPVLKNEMQLTKTLYDMENLGTQVDRKYCEEASEIDHVNLLAAEAEWLMLMGSELIDSGEYLKPLFEGLGFHIGTTPMGEPAVDKDAMADIDHEAARVIERYRNAEKRYTTLMGIISSVDDHNVVHTNFKQSGTVTGRMSSANPNLQNLSADEESLFPIRRAFVPRPGFFFVSIDYQQMEFRLLLDYANESELIKRIMDGHDPHDSTAELTGLTRKAAKTLNFGLVYGMGIKRLGKAIGVKELDAKLFKQQYFRKLPNVQSFLWEAGSRQKKRGFTWNWFGRRFVLREHRFSYRAPNSIIQGGCADVCKLAMNSIHVFLQDKKSRMVLQVHDEILFEVSYDEVDLIALFKQTMEKAYPFKNIPLTCSVSYSLKSFQDMIEVEELGDIGIGIREGISGKGSKAPQDATEPMVLQG